MGQGDPCSQYQGRVTEVLPSTRTTLCCTALCFFDPRLEWSMLSKSIFDR
jgi:hypothetical protein